MNNFFRSLCITLLILIPLGCTPAKKPEVQTQPKTIVVPDVSRITFESIDFEKSPEIVQALAKNYQEKTVATLNQVRRSQCHCPKGG